MFIKSQNNVREDDTFFECFNIRKILDYNLESSIFNDIESFNKSYKFAVVDKSIDLFKIKLYFKVIVKVEEI